MKPRPRWEVRVHSYSFIAAFCGLPDTTRVIRTTAYRWRWYASLQCFLINVAPQIALVTRSWATLHRAAPRLSLVIAADASQLIAQVAKADQALSRFKCPPAPSQPRGLGNGTGSGGVGRAPLIADDTN